MADRLRLAGLVAGRGLSGLRALAGLPWRVLAWLGPRAPERLSIAPQDIRTADPTVADDIYAGWFSFAGHMVDTHGHSPFELPPANAAWQEALDGFGWLRHLRAADTALARVNGRALVADWMRLDGRPGRSPAWPTSPRWAVIETSAPAAASRSDTWAGVGYSHRSSTAAHSANVPCLPRRP